MTTLTSKLLRGSMIAGLALAPVSVLAQDTTAPAPAPEAAPQTEMAPSAEAPSEDFSEAQLESFIEATVKIQELRSSFMPQIEAAETEEDKQALAVQAQDEMKAAVDGTEGLDVATYNRIGQAAQTDQELNARLVTMLQAKAPAGVAPRDEG